MRYFILCLALLWAFAIPAVAEQAELPLDPWRIDLITDSARPFTSVEVTAVRLEVHRFDLDAPANLEAQLSQGLPRDPVVAAVLARQRLEVLGQEQLATQFGSAYGGLLKALEFGLDRYPAIVFDGGESVIYGVTDLETALNYYRRWRLQEGAP